MNSNNLRQFSLISAIMDGVADHGTTGGALVSKGDHGIGTFQYLDGEMVMVDGEIYQITSDGNVHEKDNNTILPFAQVTKFRPNNKREIGPLVNNSLWAELQASHPEAENLFVSIRIDGVFREISTNIVHKQHYPGQPGAELIKDMKNMVHRNVSGTAFGFRSPPYTGKGVSISGVHLHFISTDRQLGGHVMSFEMVKGTLSSAVITDVQIQLPESCSFQKSHL